VVCGRDGAAGNGQRDGERFAGARAIRRSAVDGAVGGGLWFQTLGVFNLLLFILCAWFAWGKKSRE
jgi:hypothetical protein